MPSASTLRRAWRRPAKTYVLGDRTRRPLLGARPLLDPIAVVPERAFYPGVRFDLYDPAGNRLGWGRVTGLGDIELFDAASNRLGSVRPTFQAFANGNGMGPGLKRTIKAIMLKHPDWDRERIKMELRRQAQATEGVGR